MNSSCMGHAAVAGFLSAITALPRSTSATRPRHACCCRRCPRPSPHPSPAPQPYTSTSPPANPSAAHPHTCTTPPANPISSPSPPPPQPPAVGPAAAGARAGPPSPGPMAAPAAAPVTAAAAAAAGRWPLPPLLLLQGLGPPQALLPQPLPGRRYASRLAWDCACAADDVAVLLERCMLLSLPLG